MAHLLVPLVALGSCAEAPHEGPATGRHLVVDLVEAASRPGGPVPAVLDALATWVAAVSASPDACLVVDRLGRCAAVSTKAALLLGQPAEHLLGRDLGADLLDLLDFSDGALGGSGSAFVPQIPPLLALTSNVLARGLLRLRRPDGGRITLDAVAAPLHDGDSPVPVGAVSFLLAV